LLIAERIFDQPSVIKFLDHLQILARSFTPIVDLLDQTFIVLINGEWNTFIFLINGEWNLAWNLLRLRLYSAWSRCLFFFGKWKEMLCFDEREGKVNAI
jgi:hypothetical protein